MKKYILLFSLLVFTILAKAQSFKDVYESIPMDDRFSSMMDLRHYQVENPKHAICYFKLAEIYDHYMREIDPILLFETLNSNYSQLTTHYGLVKHLLDEKQARQDRDLFGEIEITTDKKKVGLPDIIIEVDKRLLSSKEYYNNAKTVHDNYYQCINKYNECLFKFREILTNYPNYKDLYLLATPKLIDEIKDIELNFDSSLVFFDTYKLSCVQMPHLLEVNEYELNPIITYRLEGLIEADFTAPIVQLWDFKKWSSNFIHLIETDIQKIREELVQTDNLLDKEIEHYLNNESYSNEFDTYKVDLKFQNLIGKYDHASLCNELIEYKKMKLAYVLKTRSEENDVESMKRFFLINKLRFFKELALNKRTLNEEATALKKSTTIDDVAKYIHFFGEEYNAMDGFLRWCEVEKYKNDQIFEDNLSNLNQFIEKETSQFVFKDSLIKYKEKNIAFGVQQFDIDSLQPDTTITQTVTPFQKRWFYLSGFNLNSDSVKVPFLAQINPKGDIQWNIEPKLINENLVKNTSIKNLQITYDSVCHVVSRTEQWVNDSLMIPKTFIESYTWEGKQIKQYSYDSDLDPVYFWIDEINELYLIVEKGEEQIDSVTTHHPMYVKLFNLNDSLLWERHLNLKGDLVGVTLTNSNFLFTFNCSELNVGKYFLSNKDSNMAIASIYITREGKLSHINEYKYVKNLVASSCFKLSNNTLNIIGKVDSPDQVMSKLVYLLTNENGNLDFSNLKELTFNLIEL